MTDSSEKITSGRSKRDPGSHVKQNKKSTGGKGKPARQADSRQDAAASLKGLTPDNVIFAMDIGTRTVVGVVGVQEDQCFRIVAAEVCAHKNRAMLDGQVHDIDEVAATASEVRSRLEARIGFKLKRVAIAAAGRVLRTSQVRVEKNLEQGVEIDQDLVSSLEIEGIQRAQMMLDEETAAGDKAQFYCVGYSVINYYLNGYMISKLTGHKGKTAGVDLIATFLPLIVVDSLYSVVNKMGLEVASLTLEPIAAINAAIPPDLRLLNLALVDIGAGTSDIALTRDGSVFAYAMASIAGDEITERICQRYLVDFATGEKIKLALSSKKGNVTFTDILKIKHTISSEEILNEIGETIQQLASTISQKILDFNGKAPNAVFLVGGGSRIPLLPGMIAKQLGLPEDRVVVRSRDVIKGVKYDDKKLSGPESITPYGIAVTAQMYSGKDFLTVTVNERKIKLFNSKKLTAADALIIYGLDAKSLIGRSGRGITFTVNDEVRRVRGEFGKAAEIFLNGKPASLDTPISYGDTLTVIPAEDGRNASVRAYELTDDYRTGSVKLNGDPVDISTVITINGIHAEGDTLINDGDAVRISCIRTLGELLEAAGFSGIDRYAVQVNGTAVYDPDYILMDNDQITCTVKSDNTDNCDKNEQSDDDKGIYYEGQADESKPDDIRQAKDDKTVTCESGTFEVTVNGRITRMKDNGSKHIFVDIFNYVDFDLSKPQGNIVLKLNGKPAAFTDRIQQGDNIEIYWKK
jgi:cell division protein FtsA